MEDTKIEIEESSEGFTLLELLNAIKNNIVLLLVICIAFVSLGVLYTVYLVTPMYTSTIDLQIYIEHQETTGTDSSKSTIVTQVANNIKAYIVFPDLINDVIENQNLTDSYSTITSRISATQIGSASAVRVSYQDSDPIRATKVVKALAEQLSLKINEPKIIEKEDGTTETNQNSWKFATEIITPINYPVENPNQGPSSPNKVLNIIISLLLGGIVGVVIVILKEQFNTKYTSKKEVESLLLLPVLAVIPSREDRENV